MWINRVTGEKIDAHFIDGVLATLKEFKNNSAPCSNCIFLKDLKCSFPKDKKRKCKQESGTLKGWNTTEYVKFYPGINDICLPDT